jgi:hypothetical protein
MKMRASAMTRPKSAGNSGTSTAFRVQKARRAALELAKGAEKDRVEAVTHQKQELKRKREEKEKRRAENVLKSTVYQVVGVALQHFVRLAAVPHCAGVRIVNAAD